MADQESTVPEGLAELRLEFDSFDMELLVLLNRRAELSRRIGALKAGAGLPVIDPEREKNVVERLQRLNPGPLSPEQIAEIYECIFKASRELQNAPETKGRPASPGAGAE